MTAEADALFPKAYDVLLNQLITVLKHRLNPSEIEEILREVGRAVAADAPVAKDLESRVQLAVKVLETIGGSAKVQENGEKMMIAATGCPLAAAVAVHPEVCRLTETLVAEIVKVPVAEKCDREGRPKCRFEIESQNGTKH